MEDFDPTEDFKSPAAAAMADAAFGMNGMARWMYAEALKVERREAERLKKQRQRDNTRITAAAHKQSAHSLDQSERPTG